MTVDDDLAAAFACAADVGIQGDTWRPMESDYWLLDVPDLSRNGSRARSTGSWWETR